MNKLRILFIAQASLKRELGGPKVVIELGEAIAKLGHEVTVIGPDEIKKFLVSKQMNVQQTYGQNIKAYLKLVVNDFDVIDGEILNIYEYISCVENTRQLVVARSVLFYPHMEYINWPVRKTIKNWIGSFVKKKSRDSLIETIKKCYIVASKADIINVSNHKDFELLTKKGYDSNKILTIPFGLNLTKIIELNKVGNLPRSEYKLVFLGTFDFRKGCLDIPKIFSIIKKQIPQAHLTLLGARGLFSKKETILSMFPRNLKDSIEIILDYKEPDLPNLLKEFKVAMFPSYFEGFGFAIIELMAAGIPVIAYNSPGPASILPSGCLVEPRDYVKMAQKLLKLMLNLAEWESTKIELQDLVIQYDWNAISKYTVDIYSEKLKEKRHNHNYHR